MSDTPAPIDDLITAWRQGRQGADAALNDEVYRQLKRMAGARLAADGNATLEATGLVHEAVARLLGGSSDWQSRDHFMALVALQMRAVLVDAARRRLADRRGGGAAHVTLTGIADEAVTDDSFLELHEALNRLAQRDARSARVVELTYFGGLKSHEIAPVVEVSVATVERDLAFGRSWLKRELAA